MILYFAEVRNFYLNLVVGACGQWVDSMGNIGCIGSHLTLLLSIHVTTVSNKT